MSHFRLSGLQALPRNNSTQRKSVDACDAVSGLKPQGIAWIKTLAPKWGPKITWSR